MKLFFLFISLFCLIANVFASEQLIIEPDAGREPILSAIEHANTIDLVMYGLTDTQTVSALIQAQKSGKKLQILLEPHPYKAEDENDLAVKRLQRSDVPMHWANPAFQLTHQKTFIFDHQSAMVMTFNLTHSSFKNERNFALITDDPSTVKEIHEVFNNDWQHKTSSPHQSNLIWSPDNSRQKILDFIQHAKHEIKIYAQEISDYQIVGALAKAARSGKHVQIILSNKHNNKFSGKLHYLEKAGVDIHFNKQYIIHAKVIIADNEQAIIGSINLTKPSLNDNRELSIITKEPSVINELLKTFQEDWGSIER